VLAFLKLRFLLSEVANSVVATGGPRVAELLLDIVLSCRGPLPLQARHCCLAWYCIECGLQNCQFAELLLDSVLCCAVLCRAALRCAALHCVLCHLPDMAPADCCRCWAGVADGPPRFIPSNPSLRRSGGRSCCTSCCACTAAN